MGRINELTDELLVKILSFLPTKTAVSTSILSKQWEFLWMWLPKLEYGRKFYSDAECERLRCFLHKNLPLHRAPVIERFRLKFRCPLFRTEDIKLWVLTVVSRDLRELKVSFKNELDDILPSSLYACKSLVTLQLKGTILVDVPRMVCLPCLKCLLLKEVTYFNKESLHRLLSICPVLEDLTVKGYKNMRRNKNMGKLTVIFPSLLRLVLYIHNYTDALVINTPSLRYLKLQYYNFYNHGRYCLIEDMPKLEEADIDVCFPYMEKLIRSITNVKRLALCLDNESNALYGHGLVFNELEHLNLCVCHEYSLHVLAQLLKLAPKLGVLDLREMDYHGQSSIVGWNKPRTLPKCLLSSLHTFEWSGYCGRPELRDVVIYILENARLLKTATISSGPSLYPTPDMLKELALCSKASTKCQLLFD